MTVASGTEAVDMDMKTAITVTGPGYILTHDSTNNTLDLCAATEYGVFISADESSRDAAGDLETASATVSAYPLGGVHLVVAKTSDTFTTGDTVYCGAGGLATVTAGSDKKLGLYVGKGDASVAAGSLVRIATHGAEIA